MEHARHATVSRHVAGAGECAADAGRPAGVARRVPKASPRRAAADAGHLAAAAPGAAAVPDSPNDVERFAKGTERLVDPVTVGSIHFLQQFAGVLPRRVQRPLMARSAEASPYMGFVVEPYAFFLFSEVADCVRAEALLPEGFRLCKASVFVGDEPAHLAVQSFFRVHTSAFWGARAECYLMAQDERTGLLSWVIVDYLSDTISYDGAHGLRAPSAPRAVVTTTCEGRVVVDVQDAAGEGRVAFGASLAGARPRPLDRRMWVEGNLSVGYGRALSAEGADVFSLTFLPKEMERALEIPLENLDMACSTWHADILAPRPARLACFPFAQHVLSDSPGRSSGYASERELARAARAVDFDSLRAFSVAPVRAGMAAGAVLTVGAVAALAWALFRKR